MSASSAHPRGPSPARVPLPFGTRGDVFDPVPVAELGVDSSDFLGGVFPLAAAAVAREEPSPRAEDVVSVIGRGRDPPASKSKSLAPSLRQTRRASRIAFGGAPSIAAPRSRFCSRSSRWRSRSPSMRSNRALARSCFHRREMIQSRALAPLSPWPCPNREARPEVSPPRPPSRPPPCRASTPPSREPHGYSRTHRRAPGAVYTLRGRRRPAGPRRSNTTPPMRAPRIEALRLSRVPVVCTVTAIVPVA